ncbi:hypothetical protein [Halalkalicoccus subterraneus]|uniref:hypothetical protein n=1 Tax=Halalkalicoccus subterraneus TaxID=2675002 RepID=UPI000EFBE0CC|nr:hypothetical protein [Halalkalicoccus subterraneus]
MADRLDRTDELAQKDERIAELEAQLRETPATTEARADGGETRSIEEQAAAVVHELERGD